MIKTFLRQHKEFGDKIYTYIKDLVNEQADKIILFENESVPCYRYDDAMDAYKEFKCQAIAVIDGDVVLLTTEVYDNEIPYDGVDEYLESTEWRSLYGGNFLEVPTMVSLLEHLETFEYKPGNTLE